jgi:thioredoxin-like negative regulator of GroEL
MSTLEHLNTYDFHHVLEEQRGMSLVFFTHALCSSCRAWKKLLQTYIQERADIRVFEVDAETEMALTNEFEVFHLPALFLYRDGKYHAPVQCTASLTALDSTIASLLQAPARELP